MAASITSSASATLIPYRATASRFILISRYGAPVMRSAYRSTAPGTLRSTRSISCDFCSMTFKSGPKTFTPICVRIPVESMSIRFLIGCVQMLEIPGVQLRIQSLNNAVLGSSLGPLVCRLEDDRCFGHVRGSWIRGAFCASYFSNHHFNRRVGSDDPVLLSH